MHVELVKFVTMQAKFAKIMDKILARQAKLYLVVNGLRSSAD
ncbi:hypothetical protein [uncultured Campylobacter sp.]|nr:hypothetical protein [uncultured Campylobacter sp.]